MKIESLTPETMITKLNEYGIELDDKAVFKKFFMDKNNPLTQNGILGLIYYLICRVVELQNRIFHLENPE